MTFSTTPVVCLTLAKWETVSVSDQFGRLSQEGRSRRDQIKDAFFMRKWPSFR